ncbi:MAG: hypothetical protein AABM43_09585 [Actinomycetota bacterium]
MASIIPILAPLALLACPIGMGLMMFFMGKGMMGGKKEEPDKASVEDLRAEQQRLAAEVERLEQQTGDPELAEQR